MKLSIHTMLAAVLAAQSITPFVAQAGNVEIDSRVQTALVREGVGFRHSDHVDFLAEIGIDDGRTQLVVVDSETKKEGEYEYREIWSVAYKGEPLTERRLEELLVGNGNVKVGGWRILVEDQWVVVFSVRIAADADGSKIKSAISICAVMADRKEKEWSGSDRH